jgi:hypothetical protein
MLTVTLLLALAAFVAVVGAGMGKLPLWIAVLLLTLAVLLRMLPLAV